MSIESPVPQSETIRSHGYPKSDLTGWNPEDKNQWQAYGKKIAFRNLWISVPCLLCAFAVWMYWGVITVQMLNLGFPYSKEQLFTLMSIAGLSGATLRIPSTFFIRMAGGRNTIFFTTMLLILPALGTGIALQDKETPLWIFQMLALLSGIGGGNFASSMSNISFFFPKKVQGLSLGLNAGIGNFGVTTMQILVPLAMTLGVAGQEPMILKTASGTLIGKIPAGAPTFIQNAGYVWVLILIPLVVLAWFLMNNIRDEHVSPDIGSPLNSITKIAGMLGIGMLTSALGCWALLPAKSGGLGISQWLVLPAVIAATVFLLKLLPGKIKPILDRQYKIFNNVHTWVMTLIYTMTFGSFIGYAASFPLAIQVIFGFCHIPGADGTMAHTTANQNAPSALTYAWMGAFIGAFIRPIGGLLADKLGGALITQVISVVMVAAACGVSYFLRLAYQCATPEQYFIPFFLLFLVLFLASGIGNGSTFRSVAMIFNKEQAGPVLGWTSAIAAYGAFIIPKVIGEQIEKGTPEYALYGFAAFYLICVGLNWWFYLRPGVAFKNP
ncbi:MAG: MFS transporter [Candidatus Melainabacteria bacterium]|nr:MFS transporter [Candidatus Melainabacteria bacterium]